MKNLSIILACVLIALMSCTKSNEVHPEIGDGNDEIVTVGVKDVHVEYTRTDHAELSRVVFHYCPADANGNAQQFEVAEMMKKETLFELTLDDLLSDTLYWYYYELFPKSGNAFNTAQKTFHTQAFDQPEPPTPPTPPSGAPEGAIDGLFSVGPTKKVYFSQGNLQYQALTNTWRFAEHQWDFVGTQTPDPEGYWGGNVEGSDNANISSTYSGWIDLFGWGTSGWDNGNTCYHPWDCLGVLSGAELIGHGYGPVDSTFITYDLTGIYANADWGVYNPISNGGNQVNLWRTLNYGEWYYLMFNRTTPSSVRYAKARVNGYNGLILVPDDWSTSVFELQNVNTSESSFDSNMINASQWLLLENAGAVFLPASGSRGDTTVWSVGVYGLYWSASRVGNDHANGVYFSNNLVEIGGYYRCGGVPVRLVQDLNP